MPVYSLLYLFNKYTLYLILKVLRALLFRICGGMLFQIIGPLKNIEFFMDVVLILGR